jgi:hypothetical protein
VRSRTERGTGPGEGPGAELVLAEAPPLAAGGAQAASGIELRPLEAASLPEIVALLERSLGPAPTRTEAFWRWKHLDNPFGASPGVAAFAGDELVGLRVFLRWRWWAGDEEVKAVRAVDTATDPGWQRRGLFRRMTLELVERMAQEGVSFVFNTPNEKSRAGYLQMGWRDVTKVPILVRPRPVASVLARLRRARSTGSGEISAATSAAELLAEPRLAAFLSRAQLAEPRLHSKKSVEYLRWRYVAPSHLGYRALWRLDGEGQAVVIARVRERNGLRELSVAEVVMGADGPSIEAGSALLRELVRSVSHDHDYAVACAAPSTRERAALRRAGFLPPVRLGPRFTVRPIRLLAGIDPCKERSWRWSLGDLELF